MATTAELLRRKVNRGYTDVYMKRRYSDGTYEEDWLDITRFVLRDGLNKIVTKIDSDDFDVGLYTINSVRMVFDNSGGRFNDVDDTRSYWTSFETRHLSRIKIEAGYIDDSDTKVVEAIFQGLLDERTINVGQNDTAEATILSRELSFKTLTVIAGSLSSSVSAKDAFYVLCSRGEITELMTVDISNINPANNITIDDPSVFENKKLDSVLNDLLLLTNSVLYIDGSDNLIIKDRTESKKVQYRFFLNSESGESDNIYDISSFNNGRQRVKNFWLWSGTSAFAQAGETNRKRYGITRRTVSSDAITNTATRQSILNALRDEWQYPKRELVLETDYIANEVSILDLVTLDVRPTLSRRDNLPICGHAVAGSAVCLEYKSGVMVDSALGFKIISIEHDLRRMKTILKVREKGKTLTDGYFDMILSQTIAVSFTAESSKDVNVATYGMNAQRCIVQVLDDTDDYANVDLKVQRPTSNIVRLTVGSAITQTFRILVIEVPA